MGHRGEAWRRGKTLSPQQQEKGLPPMRKGTRNPGQPHHQDRAQDQGHIVVPAELVTTPACGHRPRVLRQGAGTSELAQTGHVVGGGGGRRLALPTAHKHSLIVSKTVSSPLLYALEAAGGYKNLN